MYLRGWETTPSKIKRRNKMFDNWFKNLDDLHSYKYWKKEVIKFNKKVMQFWKDAFDDLTNNKKDKDE